MRHLSFCICCYFLSFVAKADLNYQQQEQKILKSRNAIHFILDQFEQSLTVFYAEQFEGKLLLDRPQRQLTLQYWQQFVNHIIALQTISSQHKLLENQASDQPKADFYLHAAAFNTSYLSALQFIELAQSDPRVVRLLEEDNTQLGFGDGTYQQFKRHFLNPIIASRFTLLTVMRNSRLSFAPPNLVSAIKDDSRKIWGYAGKGKGLWLTLKNTATMLKTVGFKAWLPIQTIGANAMGNIKFWRNGEFLISAQQIAQMQQQLRPGDIILQRREWYATNIGIPGFWAHSALYIGDIQQRQAYFDVPAVQQWVRKKGVDSGNFEQLLQRDFSFYQRTFAAQTDKPIRIIESIEPGVVFTSVEESLNDDAVAALRPRLNKLAKAQAIYQSFTYEGRSYDYNFDFLTDDALVCSELLYKSYQPNQLQQGIDFLMDEVAGRLVMPVNRIAEMYSQQAGRTEQQLDLVFFLDGNEQQGKAEFSSEQAFIESWQRPKWHALTNSEVGK